MKNVHIIQSELKLTDSQFNTLAEYGYCDMIMEHETVKEWQYRMREAMMEEEGMEEELGEPIWEPGHKNILINIFNK